MDYSDKQAEGLSCMKHPLYKRWVQIKGRCMRPNHAAFAAYGGRGITLCDEWLSFPAFVAWARSEGWVEGCGLTIDRIDNDKGYSPENCRLATVKEQSNNRRTNRLVAVEGVTKTVSEWADELGVPLTRLHARIFRGVDPVAACSEAVSGLHLEYKGETALVSVWAKRWGQPISTVRARLRRGWRVERIATTPHA